MRGVAGRRRYAICATVCETVLVAGREALSEDLFELVLESV